MWFHQHISAEKGIHPKMHKTKKTKTSLSKETLRQLSDLTPVAGGNVCSSRLLFNGPNSCESCTCTTPTNVAC